MYTKHETDPFDLADYQIEGVDELVRHLRMLIPLPVGAGKSCVVLVASRELEAKSITILCSGNALYTWLKNIAWWRPDLKDHTVVIEKMSPAQRESVWNDPSIKVIICKARTFQLDWKAGKIRLAPTMLIGDEVQKFMRKHKSKTFEAIKEFAPNVRYVTYTTGTMISKGRQEFWPALHTLRPHKFRSYWQFVNQVCEVVHNGWGNEIQGPKNNDLFRNITRDTIFRPSMEIKGLPPILRQPIPIEMTEEQARLYHSMAEDMFVYLESGDLIVAPNTLAKVTRFRQILVCPKIIDPDIQTYGASIEAVLEMMEETPEHRHCVWGTPFTEAIPFMIEALQARGYNNLVVFRHGMDSKELQEAEEFYRHTPDSIAICSIQFSQSYELETGNPLFMIGYDFDPTANEQMEGRLRRRTTQRENVLAFYMQNVGTYDDRNLAILDRKTLNIRVDVRDMKGLKELIRSPNKPSGQP